MRQNQDQDESPPRGKSESVSWNVKGQVLTSRLPYRSRNLTLVCPSLIQLRIFRRQFLSECSSGENLAIAIYRGLRTSISGVYATRSGGTGQDRLVPILPWTPWQEVVRRSTAVYRLAQSEEHRMTLDYRHYSEGYWLTWPGICGSSGITSSTTRFTRARH